MYSEEWNIWLQKGFGHVHPGILIGLLPKLVERINAILCVFCKEDFEPSAIYRFNIGIGFEFSDHEDKQTNKCSE